MSSKFRFFWSADSSVRLELALVAIVFHDGELYLRTTVSNMWENYSDWGIGDYFYVDDTWLICEQAERKHLIWIDSDKVPSELRALALLLY